MRNFFIGLKGIRAKWIIFYLIGREQVVVDEDGTPSSFAMLNRGVPQGSVLGPLLFLLYINDIGNGFHYVFHLIYADDFQVYVTVQLAELQRYLHLKENHAYLIRNRATENRLPLNLSKTKAIIIGSHYYINFNNYFTN